MLETSSRLFFFVIFYYTCSARYADRQKRKATCYMQNANPVNHCPYEKRRC